MGDDYGIADIATFPWINNLIGFYGAGELVGIDDFTNVKRVLQAFLARPAVVRGLQIPKRPPAA
jgi:GST-like protein